VLRRINPQNLQKVSEATLVLPLQNQAGHFEPSAAHFSLLSTNTHQRRFLKSAQIYPTCKIHTETRTGLHTFSFFFVRLLFNAAVFSAKLTKVRSTLSKATQRPFSFGSTNPRQRYFFCQVPMFCFLLATRYGNPSKLYFLIFCRKNRK